ncbi:hypothetical protein CC86DRAFT_436938 [Ophiobolus disseminans]|uniref:DUF7029 domain-containing protein n=1 Tax=Ophiobolus disseminans TaxID=1469910 RepID=A0A6A7A7A9_9PLEO|nr:hypothetical protein CC86DRAFT_436938 [Ophiobolus disseminans]
MERRIQYCISLCVYSLTFIVKSTLLVLALCYLTSASVSVVSLEAPQIPSRHADLKAAKRHRDLLARGDSFIFSHQVELVYAEHYTAGPITSSHIQLEADRPTLLLEDFDHHFQEVTCHKSSMLIVINAPNPYNKSKGTFETMVGGLLVSSHHSCGDDGAPTVYICSNCTAHGEMVATSGKIQLDVGAWIQGLDYDIISTGFVKVEINGFDMSIGLEAVLSVPLKQSYTLLEITPVRYSIPKIGSLGITIALDAFTNIKVMNAVAVGFSFDIKVPNSHALLNISEVGNSTITGISETKVSLKPISANLSNVEVSIDAGLRPKITAGLKLLGLGFNDGPYMSLPTVNMTVWQMGTDKVGADYKSSGATDNKFKDAFKNLTHVDYGLGIAADLALNLAPWHTSRDLWQSTLMNATQCLAYQSAGKTLGLTAATGVLEEMVRPSASPGARGDKKGSGVGMMLPASGLLWVFSVVLILMNM